MTNHITNKKTKQVPNSALVCDWVLHLLKEADAKSLDRSAVLQMCLSSMSSECVEVVKELALPAFTRASVNRLLQISASTSSSSSVPTPIAGPELATLESLYNVRKYFLSGVV